MNEDVPPDYCAPVHRSLTERQLIAGVPPRIAGLLGTAAAILVIAWHVWQLLPVIALAYGIAVAMCRRDPYIFEILVHNRGQKNRYMP